MPARRFKLPVLSRLTWAWIGFAAIGAGVAVYATLDDGRTRAAVAMAVEGVERLAPPVADREPAEAPPERLAAAAEAAPAEEIAETLVQPPAEDANDALADAVDPYRFNEGPIADVVITVDGAPARAIGAERPGRTVRTWTPIAAPDETLLRRSAYGRMPRIGADGRRAADVYAQPFKPTSQPSVALIVGGLGLNRALTERAIDELPAYVTLAFAPYAKDLPFWTKRARAAGHEVLIEIPMEARAGDEEALGAAALLTTRTPEENRRRLEWILSRFEGYFGVTNYLGAKYSTDRAAMSMLLSAIDAAGLAYFDDTGVLERIGAPASGATVNRLIEPGYGGDQSAVRRDLEALEKIAGSGGDAIGKTYVSDRTFAEIRQWSATLEERGLSLAPASAVLAMRAKER